MSVDIVSRKITNEDLYSSQMETLKCLLEHNAITKAQYDFSSSELTEKMKVGK